MENPEQSHTEALLKDLSSETLTTEYNTLKAQYDELSKREELSRQELERTRNLLEETQRKVTINQREKEAAENKMEDITNTKHESMSLVSNLRQSLAVLRSENAKLSQDTKEYSMKIIRMQTEKDAEHYKNESLKLQVHELHSRLNNLIKNEEGTRQALLSAESEIKLQNEAKQREREQASSQKLYLEKERDTLSNTVQELREELAKCKIDMERAIEKAKTAEERYEKQESSRIVTKKNHNDLIAIYERQRAEAEERIANFSAELEIVQQKATAQNVKLEQENKSLQDQLTNALDRLQVTRNSIDQLIGKQDSTTENTSSNTSSPLTTPVVGSNLLKMMKQYESTGKHWDDIYSDFFEMRDTTARLTSINNELTVVNKQLVRERDNQRQYHDQLESEIERLRAERSSQSSLQDELAKLKISSTNQISQLKDKVNELENNKKDLTASLNDTTYQLRYLLRHVESQYGTLPAEVQETNDLLGNAHIPSTLGHEATVFKDIADLQQRNQDLMTQVRHLSAELEVKSTEAKNHATNAKDNHSLLTESSTKFKALIHEQNEKLKALELRLSLTASERDRLLNQTSTNTLTTSNSAESNDIQQKLKQAEEKHIEMSTEIDSYRQEMELEMQEQRQELKQIRAEASTLRKEHSQTLMELDQVKQRNIGLVQVSSSRQSEIEDLRRRATEREGHIGELEARVLSLHNEIMALKRSLETLNNDHLSVSAQLRASDASYQRLLMENKELANERGSLTTLLQNMNESLGSSTTGTSHLVEELKQHNERLSRELQHLRETLSTKEKELRGLQAIDQREWKDKYQVTSGELKQLKLTYLELEKQLASANQERIIAQTKLREALHKIESSSGDGTGITGNEDKNTSDDAMAEQAKQLDDANNLVLSLKKDLFGFKERLADADATTNRITEEYNKFAQESQTRIDKLSEDLTSSNEKVTNLQDELEKMLTELKETKASHISSEQQWELTKSTLVQENEQLQAKIQAVNDRIGELQTELESNVKLLQQSEDRYQSEMTARVQDGETMAKLRDEVQRLNMDISTSKSEVLGAQERLRSAELSYRSQKEQLENSQNEMKLRLEESQKQQEALTAKIQELLAKVNELRTTPDNVDDQSIANLADSATQQLRDVSASLRREKEIWQARCTEAQQRATRVESDLEFVQHQLGTTRALLETVRAEKDDTTKKQLQGIKDAKNEATLYKEHNASLRINIEQLREQVTQLESVVATKEAEVEPLTLKAQGLEQELKQTKEMVQTLENRQEQWTARSALLLSKHNKTDPQEVEKLKTELQTAKTQLDEKTKSLEQSEKQYQELLAKATQTEEQLKKTTETANQRGKLAYEFKKKVTELEAAVKAQSEQPHPPENTEKLKELEDALKKQKDEHTALSTKYSNLLNKARQLNQEKKTLTASLEPLKQEKAEMTTQMESIKTEIDQMKQQLTTKSEEASSLQVEIGRMKAMQSMTTNKNEKLKKEVAALQQKLQTAVPGSQGQNDKASTSTPVSSTTVANPVVPSTPTQSTPSQVTIQSPTTPSTSTPPSQPSQVSPVQSTETPVTTSSTTTENDASIPMKRSSEDEANGQSPAKK